jgi:hypothetical protein
MRKFPARGGFSSAFLATALPFLPTVALSGTAIRQYASDTSNFPNPERGFYKQAPVNVNALNQARNSDAITLVRTYYRMDNWRTTLLPQSFLDQMDADAALLRQAGAKYIPRYSYNFPTTDYTNSPDAVLSLVLQHIAQLQPYWRRNADVIFALEAGFVGAWGEWHNSLNLLHLPPANGQILNALLAAMPVDRNVLVRYLGLKRTILGDTPLADNEAFTGTYRSRTGAHNDCLGASPDDWGTYPTNAIQASKDWLHQDNRFVGQEGETCNLNSPRSDCPQMLADLSYMRWDALNIDYHQGVLDSWRTQGCFDTVRKRLGYRLRMVRGEFPDSVQAGGPLAFKLNIVNEGWGKLFNYRRAKLVLRSTGSPALAFDLSTDVRRWLSDDTIKLDLSLGIPGNLTSGSYELFLHLPDSSARLAGDSRYAVRFANANAWESTTGYNRLNHTVVVLPPGVPIRSHTYKGRRNPPSEAWVGSRPSAYFCAETGCGKRVDAVGRSSPLAPLHPP